MMGGDDDDDGGDKKKQDDNVMTKCRVSNWILMSCQAQGSPQDERR